jgi:hypothetical protein
MFLIFFDFLWDFQQAFVQLFCFVLFFFFHFSLHKNRRGYLRYTNCFTLPTPYTPREEMWWEGLFMFMKDLVSLAAGYDCMFMSFVSTVCTTVFARQGRRRIGRRDWT